MESNRSHVRNIAIIAHVDHGKTTLVDQLLKQSGTIKVDQSDRVMDSNDLERERGITILAKNTGIVYGDYAINIVDTPGHSDFGGEVERTLQMVEGFLLLVDAAEGVLPGTRFVLSKALQLKLRPIVLINKIDRKDADIEKTESAIHDLFLDLAVDEDQLEFPMLYGSSRNGYANTDSSLREGTMTPLFDAIVKNIPAPTPKEDGLQLLVTSLDHSDFLGSIAVGRVFSGSISVGQQVICCKDDTVSQPLKVTKIFKFVGLNRVETQKAEYGDIIAVAGFDNPPVIGTTICAVGKPLPHPYVKIDEPTLTLYVAVNDSPFSGREGTLLTSRQIKERLEKELRVNVALRVEPTESPEIFKVSGRGQLHLGVLIENMRREGFELQVSAPEVIYKTIDGVKCEPMELLHLDLPVENQGIVMENLGKRKAIMKDMELQDNGRVKIEYEVPSRALLGFRSQYLTDTRGNGIANFSFLGYQPYKGDIPSRTKGALVSMEQGSVTGFALDGLQPRGVLFVKPTQEVYVGMIVGEHSRDNDLDVNPCKGKKLTNMRASGTDDAIAIQPPRVMDLETCMEWIRPDEVIEVTPLNIRLRKKVLRAALRK
ncbi:MAG: translational GTPase TypA [Candidatus Babeliales bacterium]|nr:translational GTPase TypA [Candidatus Babeliales bacterium]